jgi:DNA-binding HxlR family transcriptional regulator
MAEREFSCGLEAALSVIGGKWKFLILFHIGDERRRFGELRRLVVGVSEKMLIQQLREMERDGIIHRHDFREVPPRVEYSMTEFGRSLGQAVVPLCAWGGENQRRLEALAARTAATAAAPM